MRKILKYMAKARLFPLLIITACMLGLVLIDVFATDYTDPYPTAPFDTMTVLLIVISYIIPIFEFAFKMKKRSIDQRYSLPVKRTKLYLSSYLVGLLEILIPFTFTFLIILLVVSTRTNKFDLNYFWQFYGLMSVATVISYSIMSFAYTRANTILDGILFMVAYTFIIGLVFTSLSLLFTIQSEDFYYTITSLVEIFIEITAYCDYNACRGADYGIKNVSNTLAVSLITYSVLAVIAFGLFLILNKKDKSENSEDKSESWFGFKTLIPIIFIALLVISRGEVIIIAVFSILALLAYFIYNRGFKLSLPKIITYVASLCAGTLILLYYKEMVAPGV